MGEGTPRVELFHGTNDPDSAEVRRRVTELELLDQVRFRNVVYEEVTRDLTARGGSGPPAVWDGERLHEGKAASLAVIEGLSRR